MIENKCEICGSDLIIDHRLLTYKCSNIMYFKAGNALHAQSKSHYFINNKNERYYYFNKIAISYMYGKYRIYNSHILSGNNLIFKFDNIQISKDFEEKILKLLNFK